MLVTPCASEFLHNNQDMNILNITEHNDSIHHNTDYPDSAQNGFIFPNTIKNFHGISVDDNCNGIEDFIEIMAITYTAYEYIDTYISLTQPAAEDLIHELEALGCRIIHRFSIIDGIGVSIPVDKLQVVGRLPIIEMIQSVHKVNKHLNQAIPLVRASQSILDSNGYNGIDGEGVTIAVIDSGIDGSHSAFRDRIIAFKDYYRDNDDLNPNNGMDAVDYDFHGTMCASCAASSGSYKGAAPGAYIISIAIGDDGIDMAQAIEWCINNKNTDFNEDGDSDGPDIITLSMGVGINQQSWLDSFANNAVDNGIVFVTSAGNFGPNSNTITSPATSTKVIAVGSVKKTKAISSFSSRGPFGQITKPDVVAVGEGLTIAYPGNQWVSGAQGTSFSGPTVAGVAALLLQYDPDLTPNDVKEILTTSAEDLGSPEPDNNFGWGLVDAVNALNKVLKVKSITPSSTNIMEDTTVTFTAKSSGTNINKYEWDFDGDGKFDQSTTEGVAKYTYTKAKDDPYEAKVRITNQLGKTAENSVEITVTNRVPIANLEIDEDVVYEDEPITFNGSKSWDTDSDIASLEFSWSFDDGLNFTNFTKEKIIITHSFNKSGEYNITMKVKDDDNDEDEKTTTITVHNFKPIADAGGDKIAFEEELIEFSGFNTNDTASDLPLLNYTWRFGDNTIGYDMNVTHSYLADVDNQTFEVVLTVKDDDKKVDRDTISVIIRNKPPDVTVGADKYGDEDAIVQFVGTGNDTDNDNHQLSYKWIFGDGNNTKWLNNPYTEHSYTMVGIFQAKLLVKDPKGAIGYDELNVTISNVLPNADFDLGENTSIEDELVTFDASASFDTESDNGALHYIWDFGDGIMGTGKVVKHRYYKAYKYSIKLTVKDDDSATATIIKRLTVENQKPEAKIIIKGEENEYRVNELIRFYGVRSTDTPSDKRNLTYQWDFGDGTHSSGINATHKYIKTGEYSVRLKVVDDDGDFDEIRATIVIVELAEEDDIFVEPTVENMGIFIYTGMAVAFIILFLILFSLVMTYRGKKGLVGRFQDKLGNLKKSSADEGEMGGDGWSSAQPTGMTSEQEEFFTELYGVTPQKFMQYGYSYPQSQIQPPMSEQPMPGQPMPGQPMPMNASAPMQMHQPYGVQAPMRMPPINAPPGLPPANNKSEIKGDDTTKPRKTPKKKD